jgi:hypothetical protein
MTIDDFAVAGIGALITALYMLMGIGAARMLAKIKDRELRIFDVFFWFVVLGVFASIGDCE